MSQARRGIAVAALGMIVFASGCATRGQMQEQRAALELERAERIAGDQQIAADVDRLGTDMRTMATNVDQLRSDLLAMDNDFGAKLTQLEEGLQLSVPVHFGFDQDEVRPQAEPVLDRFAQLVLRHYPDATITVEGFTDPAGDATYNRQLAERRAQAVREALVSRGLPATQLRAVGYGSERLVVPNASGNAFGAELNRRVVFVIETPAGTAMSTVNE
jgi:peptidoglycan-associated lipoprotein